MTDKIKALNVEQLEAYAEGFNAHVDAMQDKYGDHAGLSASVLAASIVLGHALKGVQEGTINADYVRRYAAFAVAGAAAHILKLDPNVTSGMASDLALGMLKASQESLKAVLGK